MNNPFVEKIERELEQLGIQGAQMLRERYDEQSFGNALAVYKVGNLCLNFVRDRGDETVDFLNPSDQSTLYTFSDMSLVMGWTTLEEWIDKYGTPNLTEPPPGPIPLGDALELINAHFNKLQRMFSSPEVGATLAKLQDASRRRCKAFFG